ncbi:MAG: cytochrome c oxidase subunit 3 [Betaproteobacteria bacterium HGW-Betaproteobacteria-6]|jgi:cytochrome c oxidase subunit 3|nr:MAG: cytochrome c oxidase subunit 3 [Betaproteobacteria bacterium HGW-Betaproteobacteria-6]
MKSSPAHSAHAEHYFVPQPSLYPVILSAGMFLLALGFIQLINNFGPGKWIMLGGTAVILYVLFGWFGKVIGESQGGSYRDWEDRSFRYGMIWFIATEVMFFAAFFGALFYVRVISVPTLGGMEGAHGFSLWPEFTGSWPTSGPKGAAFTPMGAWGIPALNTALLLSSGATVTWAHWGLLRNNRRQLALGLAATVLLGSVFLGFQAYEYHHAYTELGLTMGAGAYGATFFMLTGFHGFHVTLGTIMLAVILLRSLSGHFSADRHFAFEAVAWYWHFVDVVWLILFVFVYWV